MSIRDTRKRENPAPKAASSHPSTPFTSVEPGRALAESLGPHETRILVVDDDQGVRRVLRRVLADRGFEVQIADSADAALEVLVRGQVDVLLLDVMMPSVSGLELLKVARERYPDVQVIMISGDSNVDTAVNALKLGACDFLTKPFGSIDAVSMSIRKAAQHKRLLDRMRLLEQQLEHYEQFGDMVGNSPVMQQVYELARGVASTSASVLIQGETGTGKELVARAIHRHSNRSTRAFVAVNCSAIPIELVESELFGHVRGAFTGATVMRAGLFETGDRGTVFLDEIGDLPLSAQVKLLRTLQEGEIKPVGSDAARTVDVRIIAAANVDLLKLVEQGRFRKDLYYRLNVIAIHVPPLRKRREDIPALSYHFLRKSALRVGRAIKAISPEAMHALREHRWNGNVRELENAIEHAVVLARGDSIVPADLPFVRNLREQPVSATAQAAPETKLDFPLEPGLMDRPFTQARKLVLQLFEETYINAMLASTHGNISEAARRSGIDRSNFRRVLKKFGGDDDPPPAAPPVPRRSGR